MVPDMTTLPTVFLAYPGQPALLAETMRAAAEKIEKRHTVTATTWESLKVDGRVMISEILREIDSSTAVLAEIGALNANVLFEVGYALASERQVLLMLDPTDTVASRNWKDLGVLSSIGYTPHEGSSEELARRFGDVLPHERTDKLWEDLLVAGNAGPREARSIFYMPVGTRGDAGKTLDRTLMARRNLSVNTADEEVQGLAPLSWYVAQLYGSSAALAPVFQ